MKVFYATFGWRSILGNHILKVFAIDESEAREILHRSRLLQSCVAFIYAEDEGLALIQRFGYTVIEGKIGV